ncbi:SDR family NAD(P)-dependent oxidoreductase [Prauserella cavernicola]|uniref:SDR family oxidoreductase n=1 Tax=Prauserella cavernicola TaxID=2800127 RepID=A0A934QS90_9PSEU|nr:SDR family oxidoreductase [Prauserella cavernicola]MBK1785281.1 SDR family oxidoreductase [Prauserella cavernicola]
MLLTGQVAIVHGGSGIIGGAVARVFAREGATVHVTGRSRESLHPVLASIADGGGQGHATALDVTDEAATKAHADSVVERAGSIDILFNAVTHRDVQGTPLLELPTAVMEDAVLSAVRAQTATIRAAATHMAERGSGVVLTNVGYGPPFEGMGTTVVTWQLVEALYRQWAVELGPRGVRVAWTRIGGTVEGVLDGPDYGSSYAGDTENRAILDELESGTMLRRLPSATEIAEAAAYLASDRGASITAAGINLTAGAVSD